MILSSFFCKISEFIHCKIIFREYVFNHKILIENFQINVKNNYVSSIGYASVHPIMKKRGGRKTVQL
jgi:hypothetical protein